ncbi:MAG: GtrA family protein [Actinomycetota bacterium]|nr:GtrA family protein [Actinomycetota bacterium]
MSLSLSDLRGRARTPGAQKAIRYSLVSVVAVAVNQVSLFVLQYGFHWTAKSAAIAAAALGGVPSYYLNRRWAWGKTGRSHLLKEVAPFWVIAFAGLVFSTWAADFGESLAKDHFATSRFLQALTVNLFALGAFGILWVGKFIFFNKVLFVTKDEDLRTTLAEEVVA